MKLIPTNCEQVASGFKNNKKWTIYKITGSDGKFYKSFDAFPLDTEVEVNVEEKTTEKNGKTYKDFWIQKPRAGGVSKDFIFEKLKTMDEKLNQIISLLDTGVKSDTPKVDVENLPF